MKLSLHLVLDGMNQEAAQIRRRSRCPAALRQLTYRFEHHFFGNLPGLGADPNFGQEAGQADGPQAEIRNGRPDSSGRITAEMI